MPDTAAILNEAYELIEQGDLPRARSILQPLLESDSQNPDVWWLYTHAAADENEGRRALDRVQALDPNYPGATELRERMGGGPRVLKPLASLKPQPTTEPSPVVVPVTPPTSVPQPAPVLVTPSSSTDPDLDDEFDETDAPQGRSRSGLLILLGVAAVVIAVLLFGFTLLNQPPEPTPTDIAGLGTPVSTFDPLAPTTTIDPAIVTPLDSVPTVESGTVVLVPEMPTIDSFSETATALIVPTSTTVSAQSATEEPLSTTDEALASVTEEVPLTTQNALTVDETAEATLALTSELLATVEATLELPLATLDVEATTESALVTEEPAATVEAVVTEEPAATAEATLELPLATEPVLATETVVATEEILATQEILLTQESNVEVTEAVVTPTEEPGLIIPTEELLTAEATVAVELTPTEESGLIIPTEELPTAEATQDPLDTLAAKLESLNVTRDNIVIAQTELGQTLIVEVCAPPVATATTALTTAMSALAETVTDVTGVEAVGVNLSCDDTKPFVIAAPAFTAEAYGRGEIDTRTFRQGWAPTDLVEPAPETNG